MVGPAHQLRGVRGQPQTGPRRGLGQQRGQRVAEHGDAVVAEQHVELAGGAGRVEGRLGAEDSVHRLQRQPGLQLQLLGQRGQPVLVADPGEQLVAEVPAQLGQGRRQRRLGQPQLTGGAGHAALVQERVQRDQQVEVQVGHVHPRRLAREHHRW
ncbi:hypothetical protein GCM10023162_17330 [Klenkia terrae]